jgi:hypothetical protein
MSRWSCSRCPVPIVLLRLFPPGCPAWMLRSSYPILSFLSTLSCPGCIIPNILSWSSCPGRPLPEVPTSSTVQLSCSAVLSLLSCSSCPVPLYPFQSDLYRLTCQAHLSRLICPGCPFQLSCPDIIVMLFMLRFSLPS